MSKKSSLARTLKVMKNNRSSWLRHLSVFSLMLSLIVGSSTFMLAASSNSLSGEIIVNNTNTDGGRSSVTLNGEPAISGRTFIQSGTISTDANSSATVNLGKLGMVSLSPNTTLNLSLADRSITGDLIAGNVRVANSEGVAVKINTADNSVSGNAASNFSVDVTSGTTVAESAEGAVTMANGQPAAQMSKGKRRAAIIIIIGGLVATGLIIWALNNDDDVASPVR